MAAGTLDDEDVVRLGEAFVALHRRIDELTEELVNGAVEANGSVRGGRRRPSALQTGPGSRMP